MTDAELAHVINTVKALSFVSSISFYDKERVVVVELVPRLAQYLPKERQSINFRRQDFSVANVIEAYKLLIIDYLREGSLLLEKISPNIAKVS